MVALRAILGDEVFQSSYRTYGLRWIGKHPTQYDFFNSFNSLSGKDLSWFWRTWWYETWTLDQAIGSVTPTLAGDSLRVSIDDHGLAPMPIRLAITRSDGTIERRSYAVDTWLSGARHTAVTIEEGSTVTKVEIDPDQVFPDVNRSNNKWTRASPR
jgi:aminopeptidase N